VPAAAKRKPWLWVLVAVIAVPLLFFGGCAAVIAFGSRNASDHPDDDFVGSRSSAGIGDEVRDGQLAFGVRPASWRPDSPEMSRFRSMYR
jgi:hypothetical protein